MRHGHGQRRLSGADLPLSGRSLWPGAIAAGEDEDGRFAEEFARYKRRVAERCLYGVDLNPLAVELAKVSLWLETLAVDRPLTFLDAHLRCGNSLVGAPLRDEHGRSNAARLVVLPDAAFKTTSKEATPAQKTRLRALAQRNKEEVKRVQAHRAGQTLFDNILDWNMAAREAIERALADTLRQRLELETSDEKLPLVDAVALVHRKEQLLATLEHAAASRYRRAKAVCDLWCAVWFWPEPGTLLTTAAGKVVAPEPPTTQVFLELAGALLDVEPSSLDPANEAAYLAVAAHVAHEQRFFHWELEFPELWRTDSAFHVPHSAIPRRLPRHHRQPALGDDQAQLAGILVELRPALPRAEQAGGAGLCRRAAGRPGGRPGVARL